MPLRLAVLATCLLLGACNNTVTQDNYARLSSGMSRAEVETLLGKPKHCSGALGLSSCTWGDAARFISVQYAGDRVLLFSAQGLR
ncbi:hypothetical protein D3C77_744970 [compost metagenome]